LPLVVDAEDAIRTIGQGEYLIGGAFAIPTGHLLDRYLDVTSWLGVGADQRFLKPLATIGALRDVVGPVHEHQLLPVQLEEMGCCNPTSPHIIDRDRTSVMLGSDAVDQYEMRPRLAETIQSSLVGAQGNYQGSCGPMPGKHLQLSQLPIGVIVRVAEDYCVILCLRGGSTPLAISA